MMLLEDQVREWALPIISQATVGSSSVAVTTVPIVVAIVSGVVVAIVVARVVIVVVIIAIIVAIVAIIGIFCSIGGVVSQ